MKAVFFLTTLNRLKNWLDANRLISPLHYHHFLMRNPKDIESQSFALVRLLILSSLYICQIQRKKSSKQYSLTFHQ